MIDELYIDAPDDFDPAILSQYPIARVFHVDGHQVAISRHTNVDDVPCVTVTFNAGNFFGVVTAITPFHDGDDRIVKRDCFYARLAGQDELPEAIVAMVHDAWEKLGYPGNPHGGPEGDTAPAPDTLQ